MQTEQLIDQAVATLRAGKLVIFPTETVYGLGADARNPAAVASVFNYKNRPASNPLIVHISSIEQLADWATDIPDDAYKLGALHWPGPLTLVLKRAPHVLDLVTGGQSTVALRIPNHPIALQLLRAFEGGVVAPSANQFTRLSPTDATAAAAAFPDRELLVLDGGPCSIGIESTIVDLSHGAPRILRAGMLTADELDLPVATLTEPSHLPRVPGQHFLHYAPRIPTELIDTAELSQRLANTAMPIGLLSLNLYDTAQLQICMPSNPNEYAKILYANLFKLEQASIKAIWIEAVPTHSAWDGIRDRISKACGVLQK